MESLRCEGLLFAAIEWYRVSFVWSRRARPSCQSREQQGVRVRHGVVSRCPWNFFFFSWREQEHLCVESPGARLISSSRTALINLSHSLLQNTRRTSPPDWSVSGSSFYQTGISGVRPTQGPVSCTIPRENDEIPNRSCDLVILCVTDLRIMKYIYSKKS